MPKYDPWNFVSYNATDDGTTTTGFYMDTGLGLQENDGHAVVIHIAGGARVGCGAGLELAAAMCAARAPRLSTRATLCTQCANLGGDMQPEGHNRH